MSVAGSGVGVGRGREASSAVYGGGSGAGTHCPSTVAPISTADLSPHRPVHELGIREHGAAAVGTGVVDRSDDSHRGVGSGLAVRGMWPTHPVDVVGRG